MRTPMAESQKTEVNAANMLGRNRSWHYQPINSLNDTLNADTGNKPGALNDPPVLNQRKQIQTRNA
jgi:hypothetical protein